MVIVTGEYNTLSVHPTVEAIHLVWVASILVEGYARVVSYRIGYLFDGYMYSLK